MKKTKQLALIALMLIATSCIHRDLTKNLRSSYEGSEEIGLRNIDFQQLSAMKRGESCVYNIFYIFQTSGSNTIAAAAGAGEISKIKFIGKSGYISIPFSKTCTVVYGE